jgi:hypothetical protein
MIVQEEHGKLNMIVCRKKYRKIKITKLELGNQGIIPCVIILT